LLLLEILVVMLLRFVMMIARIVVFT